MGAIPAFLIFVQFTHATFPHLPRIKTTQAPNILYYMSRFLQIYWISFLMAGLMRVKHTNQAGTIM